MDLERSGICLQFACLTKLFALLHSSTCIVKFWKHVIISINIRRFFACLQSRNWTFLQNMDKRQCHQFTCTRLYHPLLNIHQSVIVSMKASFNPRVGYLYPHNNTHHSGIPCSNAHVHVRVSSGVEQWDRHVSDVWFRICNLGSSALYNDAIFYGYTTRTWMTRRHNSEKQHNLCGEYVPLFYFYTRNVKTLIFLRKLITQFSLIKVKLPVHATAHRGAEVELHSFLSST